MVFVLLDCQHWVNSDEESIKAGMKTGDVVECMNCSTFDTFRTVRITRVLRVVRCLLNQEAVVILN